MNPQVEQFFVKSAKFLTLHYNEEDAKRLLVVSHQIPDLTQRVHFLASVMKDTLQPELATLRGMLEFERQPVEIEEFIKSDQYMNKAGEIYPKVMRELVAINHPGAYQEAVFTGGIGCAKTTAALYTNAYQLYRLSCLHNPHKAFGLDPASEILIVFQSINKLISTASFRRFQTMLEQSAYFPAHFPWDPNITSRLVFPKRIEVVPISGQETGAIGQNVIAGMIDELNYMQIVQKSKQSVDQGEYDQAVALYNSIARRRKTRFSNTSRPLPGILCLASSKRYPGQFTDLKEAEASAEVTRLGKTSIYIYDYRVWDVKPDNDDGTPAFSATRFRVFVGDLARKPRLLKEGEEVAEQDQKLVVEVPEDFRGDFERDIINSLREIAGVSTLARHPYFVDVESVAKAFGRHRSVFTVEKCDFVETKVKLLPSRFYRPEQPRFAHVDLAISGDSAGLAIGMVDRFMSMAEMGVGAASEMMPVIRFDGVLEITPPKNSEILFYKIREVIITLRRLGLNIRWVTYDSFQSRDSIQLLRQQGFTCGEVSVDRTPEPYDFYKGAVYTGRILAPVHSKAVLEMVSLERDTKTGKIDHPPQGSKDCSDAMAGVVHGLTTRREIWGIHRIPPVMLPKSIAATMQKDKVKDAA